MKNGDKYKTEGKRCFEFKKFCDRHNCLSCPLGDKTLCSFAWLELEAETSKDMISDLIEKASNVTIQNKKANEVRIEMMTNILSNRDEIQKIWQAQDLETADKKQREV